ncbi:MAG TPA: SGNH/GDSL hydrolase family protein [Baekduia sp.]|uniref:SGNH/GDSL hydrolase family protein n=1 Tax=Baekduia sp. TaxID=2600305 RepID=UPI002D79CAE6|nr:SGNH/GDSL hydrolase family protein [Baekduia sp.]HET6510120.1 SGNH/GDSL hydrolase family protein [Baekduia sp.]
MRAVPRGRTVAALLAATASLTLGLTGAAGAAQLVGLGDSYAAGPLIPSQSLNPLGCLRSDHNYAHLAAAQLGKSLSDVSCSGATTADMTAAQDVTPGPANPPQLDALSAATQTVTLSIGGNDIGFTSIIENCASASPFGTPCKDRYDSGGVDQLAARIDATAPKVAAVLQGIHARAPSARVLVIAYEPILPETGSGCWPQVPLAWNDVPYLRATEKRLNTMLATVAAANGARYVDTYSAAIGHDACKSSSVRWVEPLVPGNTAAPFHPNARGMAGVTPTIVAAAS